MAGEVPPLPGYELADAGDPFEMRAGPFFRDSDRRGGTRLALRLAEHHCNSGGVAHGGLLMTMMDLCLALTARQDDPAIAYVFTISLNAEFAESGRCGDLLEAHGEVVRQGGALSFVRGQIREGDRVLLNASAVFKLRRGPAEGLQAS